jgi:hypothetical protein
MRFSLFALISPLLLLSVGENVGAAPALSLNNTLLNCDATKVRSLPLFAFLLVFFDSRTRFGF